jgi:hypothetical protein
MRKYFFLGMAFFIVIALTVAGVYLLGRAIYEVYSGWRLNKDLDELQREMQERRNRRKSEGGDEPGELA